MIELVNGGNDRYQGQPRTTRDKSEKLEGAETSLSRLPGQEHKGKRTEYRAQHHRDIHDSVAFGRPTLAQVIAKKRIERRENWKLCHPDPHPGTARDDPTNADKLADNRKIVSQHVHSTSPLKPDYSIESSLGTSTRH